MAENAGDAGRKLMAIVSIDMTQVSPGVVQQKRNVAERIEPIAQACSSTLPQSLVGVIVQHIHTWLLCYLMLYLT